MAASPAQWFGGGGGGGGGGGILRERDRAGLDAGFDPTMELEDPYEALAKVRAALRRREGLAAGAGSAGVRVALGASPRLMYGVRRGPRRGLARVRPSFGRDLLGRRRGGGGRRRRQRRRVLAVRLPAG